MPRVVSLHQYVLREGHGPAALREAAIRADRHGLFELPRLEDYLFVEGIKDDRRGRCAALWIYALEEAWKRLWGPSEEPKPKYPENWITSEDELLAPILARDQIGLA